MSNDKRVPAEVLEGICRIVHEYVAVWKRPPSLREIASDWNATHDPPLSPGNIYYYLTRLVADGKLKLLDVPAGRGRRFAPLSFKES